MDRENIESIVPLLPMQNSFLWHSLNTKTHEQKNDSVIQLNCTFSGLIDLARLQEAWDEIVKRHQALRSSVHWTNVASPIQIIHKHVDTRFLVINSEHYPTLGKYQKQDQLLPIDLNNAPAFRLAVYPDGNTSCDIVWSMSHVLLDGWSCSIVINEWVQLYSRLLNNDTSDSGEIFALSDYNRWRNRQDRDATLKYWDGYLPHEVCSSLARPVSSSFSSKQTSTTISLKPSTQSVTQVSSIVTNRSQLSTSEFTHLQNCLTSAGVSLGALLQAVFATLLHQKDDVNPVLFATTVSGRHVEIPQIERRVGMYINTVPVSIRFDKKQLVKTWLQEIQGLSLIHI